MRTTKEQKQAIRNYILSCIDLEGYDQYKGLQLSEKDRAKAIYSIFKDEGNLAYYRNEQRSFTEWLKGLPSSFNIDFENYRILELCEGFGIMPLRKNYNGDMLERYEQKFLDQWFDMMYMAFRALLNSK